MKIRHPVDHIESVKVWFDEKDLEKMGEKCSFNEEQEVFFEEIKLKDLESREDLSKGRI